MADLWPVLDRLMQWLIIPAVAAIWVFYNRLITLETNLTVLVNGLEIKEEAEREKLQLLREGQERQRQEFTLVVKDLKESIDKLTVKLDNGLFEAAAHSQRKG